MGDPIRILVADDHPLIRHAIQEYLRRLPDLELVAEVEEGAALEAAVREHRPDLLVLDLSMESGFDPAHTVCRLRESHPDLKVLVLTGHYEARLVREMLDAGIDAYALKTEPLHALVQIMKTVIDGQTWYSHRALQNMADEYWHASGLASHERMVLQALADGGDLARLAQELSVSERTITRYLRDAMKKLGARGRTEAVAIAVRRGLIR